MNEYNYKNSFPGSPLGAEGHNFPGSPLEAGGLELNVIIIGGGPIGLACALEAKKAGLSYLIIEKGTLVNSLYNFSLIHI